MPSNLKPRRPALLLAALLAPLALPAEQALLLHPEREAQLRALFEAPEPAPMRARFEEYLKASTVPADTAYTSDATDAQRQFLWRLPTVALHYRLTGSEDSLRTVTGFLQQLLKLDHWEETGELDSGMGAANVMTGAALAFDWTKEGLPADLRSAFRDRMDRQMRALYTGGFLRGNPGVHYWQNDPQNNHRWHRLSGLTLTAAALHREGVLDPEYRRIIEKELQYIVDWLPEDGTTHESPSYMVFGLVYLVMAAQASDETFGTDFREDPFFATVGHFRKHTIAPGFVDAFHYGDSGGFGGYNSAWYHIADYHHDAELQAVIDRLSAEDTGTAWLEWMNLIWRNPHLALGRIDPDDRVAYFDDLGLVFFRDGWSANSVAAMFKCSLPGGHMLNEFRAQTGFKGLNVAHDDPDATTFTLFINGEWVVENDRYSKRKQSVNHNVVLVDGVGQAPPGKADQPTVWLQPSPDGVDMRDMAAITKWIEANGIAMIEGDATGSYAVEGVERVRRTFIWKEGAYILVLDDLQAARPLPFTWMIQSGHIQRMNSGPADFELRKGPVFCHLQQSSTAPLESSISTSPADHRGRTLGWEQLRMVSAPAQDLKIATLLLPWGGQARLSLRRERDAEFPVEISGLPGGDRWRWMPGTSGLEPSTLRLFTQEGLSE